MMLDSVTMAVDLNVRFFYKEHVHFDGDDVVCDVDLPIKSVSQFTAR